MEVRNTIPYPPTSGQFRAWLRYVLPVLALTPGRLPTLVEVKGKPINRNQVREFLADPNRGMTMDMMHDITCAVVKTAHDRGVEIKSIGEIEHA